MENLSNNNSERIYKIHKYINYFIHTALVVAFFASFFTSNWTVLFISLLTFILTLLPNIFERRYEIEIPAEFKMMIVIFIYATIFLGEARGYYNTFWWWDIALHAISAVGFGFIGFIVLYILYKEKKVTASPIVIAIFTFSFAVAIGAIWEIFEFVMDGIFGLNMQKTGLIDTMGDLIVDSLGALFASFIGYLYLRGENKISLTRMIEKFVVSNPKLFKEN